MENYEIVDYTDQIVIKYSKIDEETNESQEKEATFKYSTLLAWLLGEDYIDNHFIGPEGLMVSFPVFGEESDISYTLHISEFLSEDILDEFLSETVSDYSPINKI
jgi:hypothetical protein